MWMTGEFRIKITYGWQIILGAPIHHWCWNFSLDTTVELNYTVTVDYIVILRWFISYRDNLPGWNGM